LKRAPRTSLLRSTRGAAAVEFALILLPFCMLMLGMIDYGWYFYVDLACTNAARDGARTATTVTGACSTGSSACITAATNDLSSVLPKSYTPTITCPCTTTTDTSTGTTWPQYTCNVTLDFKQLTGFSAVTMPSSGGNVHVATASTMRGQ
jgi:Flp pilus assembly protein TadG